MVFSIRLLATALLLFLIPSITFAYPSPSPSPTDTPTATPTSTPTATATATPTPTATLTATPTDSDDTCAFVNKEELCDEETVVNSYPILSFPVPDWESLFSKDTAAKKFKFEGLSLFAYHLSEAYTLDAEPELFSLLQDPSTESCGPLEPYYFELPVAKGAYFQDNYEIEEKSVPADSFSIDIRLAFPPEDPSFPPLEGTFSVSGLCANGSLSPELSSDLLLSDIACNYEAFDSGDLRLPPGQDSRITFDIGAWDTFLWIDGRLVASDKGDFLSLNAFPFNYEVVAYIGRDKKWSNASGRKEVVEGVPIVTWESSDTTAWDKQMAIGEHEYVGSYGFGFEPKAEWLEKTFDSIDFVGRLGVGAGNQIKDATVTGAVATLNGVSTGVSWTGDQVSSLGSWVAEKCGFKE